MTKPTAPASRHFLDLADLDASQLRALLVDAAARKAKRAGLTRGAPDEERPLAGRVIALIFEKQSTRTRLSFDAGARQLGAETMVLSGTDLQLGHGETVADTARVISRYVDAIVLRTADHRKLLELAANASVPVINGLTDKTHPCQVMADILTYEELKGPITGQRIAWVGSCTNVAVSWIHAAARFGFTLLMASPPGEGPSDEVLAWARNEGANLTVLDDPRQAVEGATCVLTDTWVSITEEDRLDWDAVQRRHNRLAPYRVTSSLMDAAGEKAVFMHCLPAHRGEEVAVDVIDGPRSVVWDEAENRLHAQKSILTWCLTQ